jgi:hypothetical protein
MSIAGYFYFEGKIFTLDELPDFGDAEFLRSAAWWVGAKHLGKYFGLLAKILRQMLKPTA